MHLGTATEITGKQAPAVRPEPLTLINVTNGERGRQQLTLSPGRHSEEEKEQYELPPLPGEGAFDARFASQRFHEEYRAGETAFFTILIQSASYPVQIVLNPGDPGIDLSLADKASGRVLGSSRNGAQISVTLPDPGIHEIVARISPRETQPAEPCLLQSFPNPFNPTSTIRYSLSGPSDVRLLLTDALGRELGVLDRGMRETGVHQITIDGTARKLSSGVYFYRLETMEPATGRSFTAVRKLIYIR
jgi:hypothetical protein